MALVSLAGMMAPDARMEHGAIQTFQGGYRFWRMASGRKDVLPPGVSEVTDLRFSLQLKELHCYWYEPYLCFRIASLVAQAQGHAPVLGTQSS